jgi:hypothetical protein
MVAAALMLTPALWLFARTIRGALPVVSVDAGAPAEPAE